MCDYVNGPLPQFLLFVAADFPMTSLQGIQMVDLLVT